MGYSDKSAYSGPLHQQVLQTIRSRIEAGEWEAREPLPGEVVLSQELGVSVGTVRRAMDQLTRENIVTRERGRGTFLRGDAAWRCQALFGLRDRRGRALTPQIRLVACSSMIATAHEITAFKLHAADAAVRSAPRVLRLQREWTWDATLLCRETIALDPARFAGLHEALTAAAATAVADATLFSMYERVYRVNVARVQWTIDTAEPAGCSEACAATGTTYDDELENRSVAIDRVAYDTRGKPFELCRLQVMTDHCVASITH